ncbi:hypothetical protein EVAR_88479_1 [Eumeta japonica]|uniref:Uncharacterized protein n=1 Tax=Eumeta variegata TaxID=151549 RepID=A0A4C1XVT7_EUMVA|nr:hypothetical protein EVAR_88479_1 [Eumeta japonica]
MTSPGLRVSVGGGDRPPFWWLILLRCAVKTICYHRANFYFTRSRNSFHPRLRPHGMSLFVFFLSTGHAINHNSDLGPALDRDPSHVLDSDPSSTLDPVSDLDLDPGSALTRLKPWVRGRLEELGGVGRSATSRVSVQYSGGIHGALVGDVIHPASDVLDEFRYGLIQRSQAITSFKTYYPAPTIIHRTMFCWAWILFFCDMEQSAYHAGAAFVSRERM